jgi:hypothetical protein
MSEQHSARGIMTAESTGIAFKMLFNSFLTTRAFCEKAPHFIDRVNSAARPHCYVAARFGWVGHNDLPASSDSHAWIIG